MRAFFSVSHKKEERRESLNLRCHSLHTKKMRIWARCYVHKAADPRNVFFFMRPPPLPHIEAALWQMYKTRPNNSILSTDADNFVELKWTWYISWDCSVMLRSNTIEPCLALQRMLVSFHLIIFLANECLHQKGKKVKREKDTVQKPAKVSCSATDKRNRILFRILANRLRIEGYDETEIFKMDFWLRDNTHTRKIGVLAQHF